MKGKRVISNAVGWNAGRKGMLIFGILLLAVGAALWLWRGRPMLFALLVGLGAGAWCILWAVSRSRVVHGIQLGAIGLALAAFVLLEGLVLYHSRDEVKGEPTVLVVLGAAVWQNGPSPMMVTRCEEALSWWQEHPDTYIIVSGGQGAEEPTSEAEAMADYLTDRGVPPEQILKEEQSRNTLQNLQFSAQTAEEAGLSSENMVVVSNGFHLCRVKMLADRLEMEISVLAAPSPEWWLSRVYFTARESLGLVKSWLFDR